MNINDWLAGKSKKETVAVAVEEVVQSGELTIIENPGTDLDRQSEKRMYIGDGGLYSNTGYVPIFTTVFNGEKNPGELGSPRNLIMDYRALRFRAYEAHGKSDVIRIVTSKVFKWVIGSGLKMQAIPDTDILKFEGVKIDKTFVKNAEAYFALWAESPRSDYDGRGNLHVNALKNLETEFLGGDVLTVCRIDDNFNITVQIIDGQHVQNPISGHEIYGAVKARGNIILHGIEMNMKGEHIAFYVYKQVNSQEILGEWERIEAVGKTSGCLMAWMCYGDKHRIDHHRGMPKISAILEKVTKLDRGTEATVSGWEERQKIVYTIVHGKNSDGENPLLAPLKRRIVPEALQTLEPIELINFTAKQISATENKQVHNMPIDSELKAVGSNQDIDYEPFFKAIFVQICASMDIPPEVALQQYNSNYSASRAAINGWGYIIDIYRKKKSRDFYQQVYNLWLYVHILKNKIPAKGYLEAKGSGNVDIVEAYSRAKFTGVNMPHIDPLKEANAIRVMLGINDQTPLITHEAATEQLGNGEFDSNVDKIKDEMELIKAAGLPDIVPLPPTPPTNKATKI
jgi:capsid protein